MTYDAAFEALKQANPEPDPAALIRELRQTPEPTTIVIRDHPVSKPVRTRRPFRWRPLLAGGMAMVALVTLLLVPGTNGRSVLDSLRLSPVDVVNQYMEARNAYDSERAGALMTDDAFLLDVNRMTREELELGFESLRVYGMQFVEFECDNRAGSTLVRCIYQMDSRLSEIVGFALVEGRIQFLVENGRITSLVHDFNFDDYATNVFEPYIRWLEENHPGAREQLFVVDDGVVTPILTEASLDLAESYLDAYDRFLND
ncbi:MAG TPA: hypothetical protein VJ935_08040 [Acidimicrobiia bacterium]|nr:hypothetical protein [Acidimicrobiia bacterium]